MATKIPILQIEDYLIASIQIDLDDRSVVEFQTDLLNAISNKGTKGVILDITAIDLVDSFMGRSLNDIAVAVHLLGSKMIIVGMQPSVAITLVEMGLDIPDAITALNLDAALKILRKSSSLKDVYRSDADSDNLELFNTHHIPKDKSRDGSDA